ncbi:methylmalonyl-CoA mutase family protein [Ekhidna sp.]|uniref:methylmalonyl-CoA mutase family protein n=1 Tax=Ekhidna sp. TaxID=2608089 RepID=UPI00329922AA
MKNLDLNTFPTIDKKQWLQLAQKQLKGANPINQLAWENDANLALEGYYDQSDIANLKYLEDFFTTLSPHQWKLYESIEASESEIANKKALMALMGGCDGVILENPNPNELNIILRDVNQEICDINILADTDLGIGPKFTGFHKYPNGDCSSSYEKKNSISQLTELLNNINGKSCIHRIALSDFFLEIATVRALRYLLDQMSLKKIHIHSEIPLHGSEEHQLFLNTTAGLASILGGSHSINLSTATHDSRISRNIGNLIREESGIETYSDQCGGSYYIEVLTDKIIKQVTEKLK